MPKTINIYLTKEQREDLKVIMAKNHVSTTTICDIITYTTYKYFNSKYANEQAKTILTTKYLQKTTKKKTSIKYPKCLKNNQIIANELAKIESMYITNAILLYITKDFKKYLNEEGIKQYYREINEELQKRKEQFYDYNNFVRSTRRAIRENKDYYKKAIEQEEKKHGN